MSDNRRNTRSGNVDPRRQQPKMSKKAMRKKRRKRKIILLVVELILLAVVLAGLWVWQKLDKIDTDEDFGKDVANEDLTADTKAILGEYTTIALFGLDNRANGNYKSGNSDVIMIARIDNETKEVKLVSVYRDTMLNMMDKDDEDAYSKANAAYNMGGPDQAVRMLNVNLDLDIKEYVSFDFNAVAEAVDLLGGVEVEISTEEAVAMQGYQEEVAEMTGKKSKELNVGGTYNLDGVQAVSYARLRYVGNGDFQRTERQRLIVNKMVEKALASDLGTINELIDTIFPEVKTSLTKTEILSLAKDAFGYSMGENTGFPFDQETGSYKVSYQSKKASCVIPADLASNVKQLHEFLYGTTDYEVTESVQNISDEIVNRTGVTAPKKDTDGDD
ncbi:LCP family protein [Roseburia sp. 499]|uniref:LCP family protein n=1 Tax=Roseburia sp. 499 TaxID=1261634 RepID=UPI001FA90AAF|nr:LCP family protein [Roseburia sp. 499]WVK69260.1 LCP family protein [Roseburia sp. 499]